MLATYRIASSSRYTLFVCDACGSTLFSTPYLSYHISTLGIVLTAVTKSSANLFESRCQGVRGPFHADRGERGARHG
jgi:hypothetical protein